jgi:hypothetical protein
VFVGVIVTVGVEVTVGGAGVGVPEGIGVSSGVSVGGGSVAAHAAKVRLSKMKKTNKSFLGIHIHS